jgi:hypothetical protein
MSTVSERDYSAIERTNLPIAPSRIFTALLTAPEMHDAGGDRAADIVNTTHVSEL